MYAKVQRPQEIPMFPNKNMYKLGRKLQFARKSGKLYLSIDFDNGCKAIYEQVFKDNSKNKKFWSYLPNLQYESFSQWKECENTEYEVEEILSHRKVRKDETNLRRFDKHGHRCNVFFVKFKFYPDPEWIHEDLLSCHELINIYHKKFEDEQTALEKDKNDEFMTFESHSLTETDIKGTSIFACHCAEERGEHKLYMYPEIQSLIMIQESQSICTIVAVQNATALCFFKMGIVDQKIPEIIRNQFVQARNDVVISNESDVRKQFGAQYENKATRIEYVDILDGRRIIVGQEKYFITMQETNSWTKEFWQDHWEGEIEDSILLNTIIENSTNSTDVFLLRVQASADTKWAHMLTMMLCSVGEYKKIFKQRSNKCRIKQDRRVLIVINGDLASTATSGEISKKIHIIPIDPLPTCAVSKFYIDTFGLQGENTMYAYPTHLYKFKIEIANENTDSNKNKNKIDNED